MTRQKWDAIKSAILSLRQNASDEMALEHIAIYPEWKEEKTYSVDDRVRYQDSLYKCLQSHSALSNWNPVDASSLWQKILIPDNEEIYNWEQPIGGNGYSLGDKVKYEGKIWQSTFDGLNVWIPGQFGWEMKEE